MPLDTERVVERLYRETTPVKRWRPRFALRVGAWFREGRRRRRLRRQRGRRPIGPRLRAWARKHARKLTIISVLLVAWVSMHIYWFNRLTRLKFNVDAVWSQVEAEQERRYHIQLNMTRLVIAYAQQERSLMVDLTELRSRARGNAANVGAGGNDSDGAPSDAIAGAPGTLDELVPNELNSVFPQIMMMAEQYPNLRSTENFQQFSQAIIDTETRVTERIHAYNTEINKYTTVLQQFPGNVFGAIWGFDTVPFYTPAHDAVGYHVLQYDIAGPTKGPISGPGSRSPAGTPPIHAIDEPQVLADSPSPSPVESSTTDSLDVSAPPSVSAEAARSVDGMGDWDAP